MASHSINGGPIFKDTKYDNISVSVSSVIVEIQALSNEPFYALPGPCTKEQKHAIQCAFSTLIASLESSAEMVLSKREELKQRS